MAATARWLLAMLFAICCSSPVRAQVCIGDCDGNGRPTIDELIRGVNILLERATLTTCPTLDTSGDGKVAVNELVRAVGDILFGCGVTPPTATPTVPVPTATASATLAASPTPTIPINIPTVAGQYREEQYELVNSSCIDPINDLIEQLLADLPACVYTVTQSGTAVTITDCDGVGATGVVDQDGRVVVDFPTNDQTENGCTLVFDPEFSGDLTESPATVQQSLDVSFLGSCEMPPCAITVSSRWTRL